METEQIVNNKKDDSSKIRRKINKNEEDKEDEANQKQYDEYENYSEFSSGIEENQNSGGNIEQSFFRSYLLSQVKEFKS